jgi:purine-nucleoside phosphorylase
MNDTMKNIHESVQFIRTKTKTEPSIGIILGTGLGALVREIQKEIEIDYTQIPHFPLSTVESHAGKLIFGTLGGKSVIAMQGRFHFYEGYTMQQITFPVRVMKMLGVTRLLVSNACGGMNPQYRPGEIMIIDDHINLLGDNPLRGKNEDTLGPRFPDMSQPYSKKMIDLAQQIALNEQIKTHKGVFVAVMGPNLETRAEYRFLRSIGADVVGMSTVPEVIIANHMGMQCCGFSIITDECFPDSLQPVDLPKILKIANETEPKLTILMKKLVEKL